MAALTAARATTRLGAVQPDSPSWLGVKAATKIYAGSIVVNDAGVMAPGRTATGLIAMGIARNTYDNSAGAANAINGEAEEGVFILDNSTSGDLITTADIGKDCYIVDDHTVAKTDNSAARSRAGKVFSIEAAGVAVQLGVGK